MEKFKIEYFKADFPELELPIMGHLDSDESGKLFIRLKEKLGMTDETKPAMIYYEMLKRSIFLLKIEDPSKFVLSKILTDSQISVKSIHIDWGMFDDIDIFSLKTVDTYFEYLWYEKADDLIVFDETVDWILIVDHEGYVHLLKTKSH